MTDRRDPEVTVPVHGLPSPATRWNVQCLNCGAELRGHFCFDCGQRAVPAHPTVRELAGDAIDEFTGWDGKFVVTLRTLLRRPGELTRQWLQGRRVHFISPVRLYLTASLLYFLVAASAPRGGLFDVSTISVGGVNISRTAPGSRPDRLAEGATQPVQGGMTREQRDSIMADIEAGAWLMRPLRRKAVDEPNAISAGVWRWMPRVVFTLLPMYAGVLALFYRRRNYPEHLYFAIHLHAFVFLALMLSGLVKFTRASQLMMVVSSAVAVWIVCYSVLALRRVYGGSILLNFTKGVGIILLYAFIVLPMLTAAVILSAF